MFFAKVYAQQTGSQSEFWTPLTLRLETKSPELYFLQDIEGYKAGRLKRTFEELPAQFRFLSEERLEVRLQSPLALSLFDGETGQTLQRFIRTFVVIEDNPGEFEKLAALRPGSLHFVQPFMESYQESQFEEFTRRYHSEDKLNLINEIDSGKLKVPIIRQMTGLFMTVSIEEMGGFVEENGARQGARMRSAGVLGHEVAGLGPSEMNAKPLVSSFEILRGPIYTTPPEWFPEYQAAIKGLQVLRSRIHQRWGPSRTQTPNSDSRKGEAPQRSNINPSTTSKRKGLKQGLIQFCSWIYQK